MMRILLVTPSLPYPPAWGFAMRVFQLIRELSLRQDVSVLAYAGPDDPYAVPVLRQLGTRVYTVARPAAHSGSKRLAQVASLLSPVSYQRRGHASEAMQSAIDQLLSREQFDIVQVESSQMAGFDFGDHTSVVLDEHNIEYELLWRV